MVGKRLLSLANAIQDHEGWGPDDLATLEASEETPSFRNNNPGNLTASPFAMGNRGRFAYFYNEQVGFFALLWDLYKKCVGETRTGLTGENTLADLLKVYAPPSENNTQAYIDYVVQKTGLPATIKLVDLLAK